MLLRIVSCTYATDSIYFFIKNVIMQSNWRRVELARLCKVGVVFRRFLEKVL